MRPGKEPRSLSAPHPPHLPPPGGGGPGLGLVGEAGPHLLQLGPRDAEHRGHESVVAGGEGRVAPVGRPHGAALRRAAALNEGTGGARGAAAAGVRVMLGLQRGGGEHGGRQSSQGAVPREGVPREPVLLQLKETKRVEGRESSGTDWTAPSRGPPTAHSPGDGAPRAGGGQVQGVPATPSWSCRRPGSRLLPGPSLRGLRAETWLSPPGPGFPLAGEPRSAAAPAMCRAAAPRLSPRLASWALARAPAPRPIAGGARASSLSKGEGSGVHLLTVDPSATTYYLGDRKQVTSFTARASSSVMRGDNSPHLPPRAATGLDAVMRRALRTAPPGARSLEAALLSFKSLVRTEVGRRWGTQKSFLRSGFPRAPAALAKVEPQGRTLTCALRGKRAVGTEGPRHVGMEPVAWLSPDSSSPDPGTEASFSSFRRGSEDGPGQLLEGRRGRAPGHSAPVSPCDVKRGPGTQEPSAERDGERVLRRDCLCPHPGSPSSFFLVKARICLSCCCQR